MEEVIGRLGDIIDVFTLVYFCKVLLGTKSTYLNKWLNILVILCFHIAWGCVSTYITNNVIVLICGVVETFLILLLYKSRMRVKIFMSIGYYAIAVAIELITYGLISLFYGQENETSQYLGLIVSKLLMIIIVIIISVIVKNRVRFYEKKYAIQALICPLFSIAIFIFLGLIPNWENEVTGEYIGLSGLIIVGMNIAIYYMLDSIQEIHELRERELTTQNQIKLYSVNMNQITDKYIRIRRIIHDSDKHLKTIRGYILNNEYDIAMMYIDETLQISDMGYKYVNSGNIVVDALVSDLLNKCDKTNVVVKTDITLGNQFEVNNYELTIILGNLLDNAYTAVTNNSIIDKFISISIFCEDVKCVIIVANSIDDQQIEQIHTGYGIQNIMDTVDNVGGIYHREVIDKIYKVEIILPFTAS